MSMERTRFPYMFWAHDQCARTPHVLTQSGMPAADPALFAGLPRIDLGHPGAGPARRSRSAWRRSSGWTDRA
jgi:hypothetical protein